MALSKGLVKSVLSGDTLILTGPAPPNGPPPEKQVSLSFISAPRLAKLSLDDGKDEPFAFESREFLRSKVLGKVVQFGLEKSNTANRNYGLVFLGEENLANSLVSAGLCKVRTIKNDTEEYQTLVQLEQAAQSAGVGVWKKDLQPTDGVRNLRVISSEKDAHEFLETVHDTPLHGIVEAVRDGSTVRVLLLPRPSDKQKQFTLVTVLLAGIQSPSFKRGEDGKEVAAEFANEAKHFTTTRLLQQDVKVVLGGVDKFQNFFGTVLHPMGNVAEELLKHGFAKCVDWSFKHARNPEALRAAEKEAKSKQLRVWRGYVAPVSSLATLKDKEVQAKVVEINSTDTITIQDLVNTSVERRVTFSSIRTPRQGNPRRDEKDAPYAWEAREFVRKNLIGKKVRVVFDYVRSIPGAEGQPAQERVFGTVFAADRNIAEGLVSVGLATVTRHRADEERSLQYDTLLSAEAQAQAAGKGVHNTKQEGGGVHHSNDLTLDSHKAKAFLPFLQKDEKSKAVVEHVISGARFRLSVPKHSCVIVLVLSSVRCPKTDEPFGAEAQLFVRNRILHSDVDIEIESIDKNGVFIGQILIGRKPLASLLVEEGFASLHEASANKSKYRTELMQAEHKAKSQKLRLWEKYDAEAEKREKEAAAARGDPSAGLAVAPSRDVLNVCVTEVTSATHFFVQILPPNISDAAQMAQLITQHTVLSRDVPYIPKIGDVCGCQFSGDQQWYRVRITAKPQGNMFSVFYIDYGNSEVVPAERLAALHSSSQALPPCATPAQLAFVSAPSDPDLAEEAAESFSDLVLSKPLLGIVEARSASGNVHMTLYTPSDKASISGSLLQQGLLRVKVPQSIKAQVNASLIEKLNASEDYARKHHLKMWVYGDPEDDDDGAPEFGWRKAAALPAK